MSIVACRCFLQHPSVTMREGVNRRGLHETDELVSADARQHRWQNKNDSARLLSGSALALPAARPTARGSRKGTCSMKTELPSPNAASDKVKYLARSHVHDHNSRVRLLSQRLIIVAGLLLAVVFDNTRLKVSYFDKPLPSIAYAARFIIQCQSWRQHKQESKR
eukprot:5985747-Amphidinium_carterae.1